MKIIDVYVAYNNDLCVVCQWADGEITIELFVNNKEVANA